MRTIFITLIMCALCTWGHAQSQLESDVFVTDKGRKVEITFIKHGTLMMTVDNYTVHIDPVLSYYSDFEKLPKADLLLVTHEHGDHFDKKAIETVKKDGTLFLSNGRVAELSGQSTAMAIGESKKVAGGSINLTATAAYNYTEGHTNFHPKERCDVGFVFEIDNLKIYVAGDTEDIPELAALKDIDIAFLPVNQPYTMTPEQCINAIGMFSPKIVYPYHYSNTDLSPIVEHFKNSKTTEVRIKQLQ